MAVYLTCGRKGLQTRCWAQATAPVSGDTLAAVDPPGDAAAAANEEGPTAVVMSMKDAWLRLAAVLTGLACAHDMHLIL